jgi:EAL domain-containing protein (putative c-di-GMP-specific phosphodiesterase class I)
VTQLGQRKEARHIIEAILRLGEALGLQTVAEGIETKEQLEDLQDIDCPLGQGNLFSPPVKSESLERLILSDVPLLAPIPRRRRSAG